MKYLLVVLALFFVTDALSQKLDGSFGNNGKVITKFGNKTDEYVTSLIIQTDAKIIVGGFAEIIPSGGDDFVIARYDAHGNLDNSFGESGKLVTDFFAGDVCRSLLLQPNGKIIASGVSIKSGLNYDSAQFAIARYDSSGHLDSSFGNYGKLLLDIGVDDARSNSFWSGIASPHTEGHFLVVAQPNQDIPQSHMPFITRIDTNGKVDSSFVAHLNLDVVRDLKAQIDGKIVVLGPRDSTGIDVLRINSDGSMDTLFGNKGLLNIQLSKQYVYPSLYPSSVVLQQDGKILVAGRVHSSNWYYDESIILIRCDNKGDLDDSFGIGGIAYINNVGGGATAIILQMDGKMIVGTADFTLARFKSNGSLDSSFGTSGLITTKIGESSSIISLELQTDGKLVVVGRTFNGNDVDFVVARYIPDLNVGVLNFGSEAQSTLIYPNPLLTSAMLLYELQTPEIITIRLANIQGRTVAKFVNQEHRSEGQQSELLLFPSSISSGEYFLIIESEKGSSTILVNKQ